MRTFIITYRAAGDYASRQWSTAEVQGTSDLNAAAVFYADHAGSYIIMIKEA